jgi:hypothetical protein
MFIDYRLEPFCLFSVVADACRLFWCSKVRYYGAVDKAIPSLELNGLGLVRNGLSRNEPLNSLACRLKYREMFRFERGDTGRCINWLTLVVGEGS